MVKWTRGVKVATTDKFETPKDREKTVTATVNEKLSLLVTLYREDGKKFDTKEARLSVVFVNTVKNQERTVAKTKFDLSQFAGVPSATSSQTMRFGTSMNAKVTIESRFLKSGASGPGSAGTSSALSSIDGVSVRSSEDDHDDFGDLALDDIPDPEVSTANSVSDISSLSNGISSNSAASVAKRQKSSLSNNTVASNSSTVTSQSSTPQQQQQQSTPTSARSSVLEAEMSSLKKDNEKLSANMKQYEKSVSELKIENERLLARATQAEKRKENDEKILKRENDRLSATLKDIQRNKSSTDMSTKLQIESLTSRLDERASQLENAVSERDGAKREVELLNGKLDKYKIEIDMAKKESNLAREDSQKMARLVAERDEALHTVKECRGDLGTARRSLEEYRLRCKRLEGAEERNNELSREIDRLTVANATGGSEMDDHENHSQHGAALEEIEGRLNIVQEEKEVLMRKIRSHEQHAAKVKATYEELAHMYSSLRQDHANLQKEALELKNYNTEARSALESYSANKDDTENILKAKADAEESKENLQRDYDQVLGQIDTLQDRLESTTQQLTKSQRQMEEAVKEQEDLKRQRDLAMQKALSKGKDKDKQSNADTSNSVSNEQLEELKTNYKQVDDERNKLLAAVEEMRKKVGDLEDDVEYEKQEKVKAREEREKIRESARTLERRTSQAARTTDALHSLKRELSTQQMRAQDFESMVTELKSENEMLRKQVDESASNMGTTSHRQAAADDDVSVLLNELVEAKLAVAEAKGEKQQMEFEMRQMKRDERIVQERLAAKASRLEVQLEEAAQETERLQRLTSRRMSDYNRSHDAREFNELGSDGDY